MLNRLSIPVITDEAIEKLLRFLKTDGVDRDCNMFDVGYNQCKLDIAGILIRECKLDNKSDVDMILTEIRKRANDD